MLLCVATFATFTSCSKDNEDNQGGNTNQLSGISQQILGDWTITSSNMIVYFQTNDHVKFAYDRASNDAPLMQNVYCNSTLIGNWEVNDNILRIQGWRFNIEEITNSSLILQAVEDSYRIEMVR